MPDLAKMEVKDLVGSITLVCFLFGMAVYLPVLGFFFALFIPLPVMYTQTKRGLHYGIIIAAISLFVISLIIGGIGPDLLFFAELLLIGIFLCVLFEKKFPVEAVVVLTCLIVLISGATGLFLYSLTLGQGVGALLSAYVMRSLELTMALYKSAGLPDESVRIFSESLKEIHYVLVRITPALITTMTMIVVWANLLMARPIFTVSGLPVPDFGRLNEWRTPEVLIWPVICCGGILLLPLGSLKMVGLNVLIILLTVYFFQGIAIVSFYFNRKQFPKIARFLLYGLIFIQQLLLMVVIAFGFFDTWLDFRKLNKKPE